MAKKKDLTGEQFGRWTVLHEAEPRINKRGDKVRYWSCECLCGTQREVQQGRLTSGASTSCGCGRPPVWNAGKGRDLTGEHFGRWEVVSEAPSRYDADGHKRRYWLCRCSCENHTEKIVPQASLLSGYSQSCGCYGKERRIEGKAKNKSHNTFEIYDDYCIVKDNTGKEFIIDTDDMSKVEERYWYVRKSDGYVYSHNWDSQTQTDTKIGLHTFLMGESYVDHIDKNPANNRRSNLRVPQTEGQITTNQGYNNYNQNLRKTNKSGYTGVFFDKKGNKWVAYICMNNKTKYLGRFLNLEDAIEARRVAENEYCGEYSRENTLKIIEHNNAKQMNERR